MASLEPNSNNQTSFNNPSMDHPPLSSTAPPCYPTPDFGDHFPAGKLHQELAAAQPWQNPSAHLDKPNKIPGSSFLFADGGRLLPAFAGMDGYGNPNSEFVDSVEFAGVSWDGKLAYMLPPASHSSNSLVGNPSGQVALMDGTALVRQIPQPTSAGSNDKRGSSASFMGPFLMGSSPPLSEMEKLLNSSSWVSLNQTPVDPTTQGGCMPMSAVNIAAPPCLSNFSTDPGFVERAAKLSSFSNNNRAYSELIQPYPVAGDGGKDPHRSVKASQSQAKLTRGSSGYHTPRCSAPNSPIACSSAAQELNNGGMAENLFHQATLEGTASFIMDDPKLGLERRSSRSSSRVDVGEVAQKRCMSVNESDESMCQEVSSSCERNGGYETASQGANENPGKKRRTGPRDKSSKTDACAASVKDMEIDEPKVSHRQSCDGATEEGPKAKVEPSQSGNSDDSTPKSVKESSKPPEAPKPDYIHVRARRGQATDSHSLAERVRREKISERMKFLQDLVPGCSKVTGKAVMLDEIINYVQSLQRQVEFLSMKLAAVNPRPDFSIETLFGREPRAASQTMVFAPESTNPFPLLHQQQPPQPASQVGGSCGPIDVHALGRDPMLRTLSTSLASADGYTESVSQMVQAWDNELQNVVQMGFVQGRQTPLSSPSLQGSTGQLFPGQMKVEL